MFRKNQHLNERELQLFIDGEMTVRQRRQAQKHVDTCWPCRTDVTDRERLISETIHARNEAFKTSIDNGLLSTERLLQRLRYQVEMEKRQTLILRCRRSILKNTQSVLEKTRWQVPILAVLAVLSLVVFVNWLRKPDVVSAHVLLVRISKQEQLQNQASNSVEFHRIVFRTRSTKVSRAYYRDPVRHRIAELPAHTPPSDEQQAGLTEIRHIFQKVDLDWDAPLSSAPLLKWRENQAINREEVQSLGDEKYRLLSEFADGIVSSAEMTVQSADYHPVALTLELRNGETLGIQEEEYRLVGPNQVASNFKETATQGIAVAAQKPVASLSTAQTQMNLISALDQDGAFERGDVELRVVGDNHLEIYGDLNDPTRIDRLMRIIHRSGETPGLRLSLNVSKGASTSPIRRVSPNISPDIEVGSIGTPELRSYLSQTVGSENIDSSADVLCNQVLDQLSVMQAQSRALHELSKIESKNSYANISENIDQQKDLMIARHALRYRSALGKVKQLLEPAYPHSSVHRDTSSRLSEQGMTEAVEKLNELSTSIENNVWGAFSTGKDEPPGKNMPLESQAFWAQVDEAAQIVDWLRAEVAGNQYHVATNTHK